MLPLRFVDRKRRRYCPWIILPSFISKLFAYASISARDLSTLTDCSVVLNRHPPDDSIFQMPESRYDAVLDFGWIPPSVQGSQWLIYLASARLERLWFPCPKIRPLLVACPHGFRS
jgi:hypothetical protein